MAREALVAASTRSPILPGGPKYSDETPTQICIQIVSRKEEGKLAGQGEGQVVTQGPKFSQNLHPGAIIPLLLMSDYLIRWGKSYPFF